MLMVILGTVEMVIGGVGAVGTSAYIGVMFYKLFTNTL